MNVIRVYCGVEYWIATEGRSLIQSTIIFYPSVYREGKNSNNFPANHRLSALPPRDDHLPPEGKLGGGGSVSYSRNGEAGKACSLNFQLLEI